MRHVLQGKDGRNCIERAEVIDLRRVPRVKLNGRARGISHGLFDERGCGVHARDIAPMRGQCPCEDPLAAAEIEHALA